MSRRGIPVPWRMGIVMLTVVAGAIVAIGSVIN